MPKNKFSLFGHSMLQFSWNNATDKEWEIIKRFFVPAYMNAYHQQPVEELALGKKIDEATILWQSTYAAACQQNKFEILESEIIKPIKFYFSHDPQFLNKESAELKAHIQTEEKLDENIIAYMVKLIALKIYFEHCFHDEKNNIEKLAIKRIHYLIVHWHEHPVGFISCELNPKSARTYLR